MKFFVLLIIVTLFNGQSFADVSPQVVKGFVDENCSNENRLCDLYQVQIADDGAVIEDTVVNHGGGLTELIEGDTSSGLRCSKRALVPKPVYDAVMASMKQISRKTVQDLSPVLTPSEQTMLLFYNTVMQQFADFDCR